MSLKVKSQQHPGTPIERACKELLRAVYHLDTERFTIVGEMMGFKQGATDVDQMQEMNKLEETKSKGEQNAEKELERKKEAAKKRQEAILKKF